MSILLIVVLATGLGNAQTRAECEDLLREKANKIVPDLQILADSCTSGTCPSSCRSSLEILTNNTGCCLLTIPGSEAIEALYTQCNIAAPTGCSSSSASSVIISVFTVGLVSMISYIMN